ncbi:MAG: hypothetical protein JWR57_1278, partial [Mycetocola sp.]|nr:hypothetical protein [Mycetocola sp.]
RGIPGDDDATAAIRCPSRRRRRHEDAGEHEPEDPKDDKDARRSKDALRGEGPAIVRLVAIEFGVVVAHENIVPPAAGKEGGSRRTAGAPGCPETSRYRNDRRRQARSTSLARLAWQAGRPPRGERSGQRRLVGDQAYSARSL